MAWILQLLSALFGIFFWGLPIPVPSPLEPGGYGNIPLVLWGHHPSLKCKLCYGEWLRASVVY